jgi:hypothetical protein
MGLGARGDFAQNDEPDGFTIPKKAESGTGGSVALGIWVLVQTRSERNLYLASCHGNRRSMARLDPPAST